MAPQTPSSGGRHALTVRALGGSREALLRAAADLVAAGAGVASVHAVRAASTSGPPSDAALDVAADLDADALRALAGDVCARLGGAVLVTDGGPPGEAIGGAPLGASFSTEVLEHTADEGFIVRAADRADLLAAAAEALGALVVGPESVAARDVVPIEATSGDEGGPWADDDRLFAWLAEVLYHVDARRFAVRRAVVLDDGATAVRGLLVGEGLDEARHAVRGALKAVTYHALEVGPEAGGGWRAQVIVDV